MCVVFFKYWFQGSVSSEKPWGLAFEEAFPDPQRVTGGKVHELSELESFCRFKVRAHTKSRMSLYPMKGIKDVNLQSNALSLWDRVFISKWLPTGIDYRASTVTTLVV